MGIDEIELSRVPTTQNMNVINSHAAGPNAGTVVTKHSVNFGLVSLSTWSSLKITKK